MKVRPKVSVLMLVYNGKELIKNALDSLVCQDFSDFELIILDNQSTDSTPEIVQGYVEKYDFIEYIVDSERRNTHEAANKLVDLARGELFCFACDDDVWDRSFLSKLVAVFDKDENVDLVYPNARYFNLLGEVFDKNIVGRFQLLKGRFGLLKFLMVRKIVPVIFGLYRKSSAMRALPFEVFDETIADVDNLFYFRFVLRGGKVQFLDEVLFYSRIKKRAKAVEVLPAFAKTETALGRFIYDVKHEIRFVRLCFESATTVSRPLGVLVVLAGVFGSGLKLTLLQGLMFWRRKSMCVGDEAMSDLLFEERTRALAAATKNDEDVSK